MQFMGLHYALAAGAVRGRGVMRYSRDAVQLRFALAAMLVHPDQVQPFVEDDGESVSFGVTIRHTAPGDNTGTLLYMPVIVLPPLAQEIEGICTDGTRLLVCGPLVNEKRNQGMSVSIQAMHAWRL